jgi:septal ring factor EnvC (AmiA/AmiB activator)
MSTKSELDQIVKRLERKMTEAKAFQRDIARRIQKMDKEISELKAKSAALRKKAEK